MADSGSLLRQQFPILAQNVGLEPLIYLDTAATAQRPSVVIDAMKTFMERDNGAVHRGMHPLAERATEAYEAARRSVQRFVGATHEDEIIFTRGTTEGINLAAHALGATWKAGDAVVLTELEHHSNIVPWLQLRERTGIDVRWVRVNDDGRLDFAALDAALADGRVRLVSVTGQSNVLGLRPDLERVIRVAHAAGARVLVDAAQLVAHHPIDVAALDVDMLAFSGHKMYGPTGIGVLYGKRDLLRNLPPFLGGGMMIREVTKDGFVSADVPQRFEAGTPPTTEAVGLAAAAEWLGSLDRTKEEKREKGLIDALIGGLSTIDGVRILGPGSASDVFGCVSFTVEGVHPHDLTEALGKDGICLRAGHHCAQILHDRLGVLASARASVGLYTTEEDIARVAPAVRRAIDFFRQ